MPGKDATSETPRLEAFLRDTVQFAEGIINATERQARGAEGFDKLQVLTTTFRTQVERLTATVSDLAGQSSQNQLNEVEQFLNLAAADVLVSGATKAADGPVDAQGMFQMDGIFKEIKKILLAILDLFGIKLPAFLEKLLLLIDEILKQVGGFLFPELQSALSKSEVQYLNEIAASERLRAARLQVQAATDLDLD